MPGALPFPDIDENDPMYEFFRRFFPNPPQPGPRQGPQQGPRRDVPRGLGSGFIISTDGYVMTNAHVVEGADDITVTLTDRREFKGKVIGTDRRTDVALVKIEATGLPSVKIGDPNKLRVGEWVVAIGSPFGLDNSVTAGIVSAKARDTGEFLPFIQTDVAVNPGNSGGPLLNMRGEVIGINSQIFTTSGGYNGISFAIPIDEAMNVQQQLRSAGRVIRGRIGVGIEGVSKEIAEAIGLGAPPRGALVNSVEKDGPASKAGVEPGDVILRFDGRAIERSTDLPRIVGGTKPGTNSTMTRVSQGRAARPEGPGRRDAAGPAAHRTRARIRRNRRCRRTLSGLAVSDVPAGATQGTRRPRRRAGRRRRRPGRQCGAAPGRHHHADEQRRSAECPAVQRGGREARSQEGRRGARAAWRGLALRHHPALTRGGCPAAVKSAALPEKGGAPDAHPLFFVPVRPSSRGRYRHIDRRFLA